MEELANGIGLGIGFIIGLVLTLLVVFVVALVIWKIYALSLRRSFSPELFRRYSQDLLRQERFEELEEVKQIIKLLEKKKAPKDLLKAYEVSVYSDLEWIPLPDGGERLVFRRDRKIIKRDVSA